MTAFEQLTIETPEQIALEFPLAGVGSRFLAIAIDALVQAAMGAALFALWTGALAGFGRIVATAGLWLMALMVLSAFLVFYGYFALFEIFWHGQTPGKRAVGLRVISASGRPMTPYQALLRNLLRIVDSMPGLYAVGIISVLATARHQRLGDLAASTVVVREQTSRGSNGLLPFPPPLPAVTAAERLGARTGRLTEAEAALIERFLQRRSDLEWSLRERTAGEIAARVRERLSLPPGGSDEELLERVLADHRAAGAYR